MSILKKLFFKDASVIISLLILYNLYVSLVYDTLQYVNKYKILMGVILNSLVFLPMYFILWFCLRKIKSTKLFVLLSSATWLILPILFSFSHDETFNSWQGLNQIYQSGELTLYGYFHGLQNSFLFLTLYALFVYFSKYEGNKS